MMVGFSETMAGRFVSAQGDSEPILFTVDVRACGPSAFLTGTPMRLRGHLTVGNLMRSAPARGELEVRLLRARELNYSLTADGPDDTTYRFVGKKSVSPLRPLNGMTQLTGRLYREWESIGTAELSFSLRDLPAFLASFRLGG